MAKSISIVHRTLTFINSLGRTVLGLTIVIILITFDLCKGQTPGDTSYRLPYNSFNIELFGNSFLIGSLNYERIILHGDKFCVGARIGAGYDHNQGGDFITTPLLLDFIFNANKAVMIELDVGTTFFIERAGHKTQDVIGPVITAFGGIRIQSKTGFVFRFGFTPFFGSGDNRLFFSKNVIMPWVGFSFGYSFGKK